MSIERQNFGGDPAQLRVSDDDRHKVAEILRDAAGEGRIDLDELDERLEAAYAAKTYADLVPITVDLPAHEPSNPPVPRRETLPATTSHNSSFAVMGECKRQGAWLVPAPHTAFSMMGSVTLDLRSATFAEPRHHDHRQRDHGRGEGDRRRRHQRGRQRRADHGRVPPGQGQGRPPARSGLARSCGSRAWR